jgi:hypothetical protein
MNSRYAILPAAIALMCGVSSADFKYTQQSQVTGGALVSMTKTLGVFSKNARQITEPQTSTIMLKGNRLRQEHSTGEIEIIDLDSKRFIRIDPATKTYSSTTFDEFKAALQRAQEKAKEDQAKALKEHPDAQNIKIVPKFDAQATGQSKTILGLTANEMKLNMQMLMQSDDPKYKDQMQNASMTMTSDSWIAPDVPGQEELQQFSMKLAKELDWLPGAMAGSFNMAGPQFGPAMDEFRKNAAKMKGLPLLQYVSMGTAANGAAMPTQPPAQQQQQQGQVQQAAQDAATQTAQNQAQQEAANSAIPSSAKDAVSQSIGGMFGGFGHKKKKDQPAPTTTAASTTAQPGAGTGSLMDMTTQVTSYSNSALDASLFQIPAGYTEVKKNPDDVVGK